MTSERHSLVLRFCSLVREASVTDGCQQWFSVCLGFCGLEGAACRSQGDSGQPLSQSVRVKLKSARCRYTQACLGIRVWLSAAARSDVVCQQVPRRRLLREAVLEASCMLELCVRGHLRMETVFVSKRQPHALRLQQLCCLFLNEDSAVLSLVSGSHTCQLKQHTLRIQ